MFRKQISRMYVEAGAAALALCLGGAPALADANLNCSAYAGMAVADHQQNVALGCGFAGVQWSGDFNAHMAWCQQAATKMVNLTNEDKARKAALLQCAQKPKLDQQACQGYAQQAVNQAKEAQANNCGLKGGRWTIDYPGHFNWCLSANAEARGAETKSRTDQLYGCLALKLNERQAACDIYGNVAVAQALTNQRRQCGFTGGRWDTKRQGHVTWCVQSGQDNASKETAARAASLKNECLMKVCTTTTETGLFSSTVKKTCRMVPRPE